MRHPSVLVLSVAALCTGLLADSQALQADQKTGTLDIYFIDVLPVDVHWEDVAIVGLAANVICWVAALYPAWRASKLSPVGAIRQE